MVLKLGNASNSGVNSMCKPARWMSPYLFMTIPFCMFLAVAAPAPASGPLTYADIKNSKATLPYGQEFMITGDTKDVQIGGNKLADLMSVQTVAGDYKASDSVQGTITPA